MFCLRFVLFLFIFCCLFVIKFITKRQIQCTSLPNDWLAQHQNQNKNPKFSAYFKSSLTNQSFPYLPLINAIDDCDMLQLPLSTEHAVSLHNLTTDIEINDKSPTLSASFVLDNPLHMHFMPSPMARNSNLKFNLMPRTPFTYKNIRSSSETLSKCFQNQMSVSGDEIDQVNVNEIGWKLPTKLTIDPFALLRSKAKLCALRTRKNIPNSLKAIKSSIPIHSRSATSLLPHHSFDEHIYRSTQIQAPPCQIKIDREKIRRAFLKSRSCNSFDNDDGIGMGPLAKTPTLESNRNLLLLNITKSFNDEDLKGKRRRSMVDTHIGQLTQKQRSFEKNTKLYARKLPKPHSLPNDEHNSNGSEMKSIDFMKTDYSPCSKTPDVQRKPKQDSKFYSDYEIGPKPINDTPFMNAKEKIRRFHRSSNHHSGRSTPKLIEKKTADNKNRRNSSCDDLEDNVFQFPTNEKSHGSCGSLDNLGYKGKKEINSNIEPGQSRENTNETNTNSITNPKKLSCGSRSNPNIANYALNSPSQSHPNHEMKPTKRDSLPIQKPTSSTSTSNENDVPLNSSEYDVRDQRSGAAGMSRGAGGQHMLSGASNNREPSRSLSDRDQREQDSFNRSLSTTEGTPDDKIGNY